jgi:hypothetical protein
LPVVCFVTAITAGHWLPAYPVITDGGMIPPRDKQESHMSNDIREVSLIELDQVSGGSPVPGGDVSRSYGGTVMTLGAARIFVSSNGSITTWDGQGNPTTTNPTNPLI